MPGRGAHSYRDRRGNRNNSKRRYPVKAVSNELLDRKRVDVDAIRVVTQIVERMQHLQRSKSDVERTKCGGKQQHLAVERRIGRKYRTEHEQTAGHNVQR